MMIHLPLQWHGYLSVSEIRFTVESISWFISPCYNVRLSIQSGNTSKTDNPAGVRITFRKMALFSMYSSKFPFNGLMLNLKFWLSHAWFIHSWRKKAWYTLLEARPIFPSSVLSAWCAWSPSINANGNCESLKMRLRSYCTIWRGSILRRVCTTWKIDQNENWQYCRLLKGVRGVFWFWWIQMNYQDQNCPGK